jgi:hypothetical protein
MQAAHTTVVHKRAQAAGRPVVHRPVAHKRAKHTAVANYTFRRNLVLRKR